MFWFTKSMGHQATSERVFENMSDDEKGMNVVNAQMVCLWSACFVAMRFVHSLCCCLQIEHNIQTDDDKLWFAEYVRRVLQIPSIVSGLYVECISANDLVKSRSLTIPMMTGFGGRPMERELAGRQMVPVLGDTQTRY